MRRGFPLPWGRLVDLRGGEALLPTLVLMQGCAVASPIGLLYLTLSRQLQYEAFGVSTASLAYPQSVPAIAPCVPPLRVFYAICTWSVLSRGRTTGGLSVAVMKGQK